MNKQKGSSLLASLVVLSALTILGMSTLRSTNTQQVILRNTQLITTVKNIATTEINAQIGAINKNAAGERDELVIKTLDNGVGNKFDIAANKDEELNIKIQSSNSGFSQTVETVLAGEPSTAVPPPGFSLGTFENVTVEIHSQATLKNTASTAYQVQGFTYIKPAS